MYNMTHRQNLVFWLNSIAGRAPKAKIVIVCTKVDLVDDETLLAQRYRAILDCVDETLACKRGMILGYKRVSSKSDEGIQELRTLIFEKRTELDGYGKEIPVGWFKFLTVTRELVAGNDKRISYDEAEEIARTHCHITDNKEVRQMLQELHDPGLLLWRDTTTTRELVVLDTEWMVAQMTALGCKRSLEKKTFDDSCDPLLRTRLRDLRNQGWLTEAVLPEVWPELTEEERQSTLEYVLQFGLCCRVHSSDSEFSLLVPSLFPSGSPVWHKHALDAVLRVRSLSKEYDDDKWLRGRDRDFLPDTLFFHVLSRLLSRPAEDMFIDSVVVRSKDGRYMLQHKRQDQLLILTVYCGNEAAPRDAFSQLRDILLLVEKEELFGLNFRFEVECENAGEPGYHDLDSLQKDHPESRRWLQVSSCKTAQVWFVHILFLNGDWQ